MPYRQPNKPQWYVRVPTREGGSVAMSTRSTDKSTARRIERMLEQFKSGGKRSYMDLIDAVHAGRLRLLDLEEADSKNNLDGLRNKLNGVGQEPNVIAEITTWRKWLSDHVADDTADHYVAHVLSFVEMLATGQITPVGNTRFVASGGGRVFTREDLLAGECTIAEFTLKALKTWQTNLSVSSPTKRKYHSAMSQFIGHLQQCCEFGPVNPMAQLKAPSDNDPRSHYLETDEALRLVRAFADPMYAAYNALMAGSGADVSAALEIRRRDVYTKTREVRAPGTKTYSRNRVVRVADWAWPFLEALLPGLDPDDKVFSRIPDRWTARDVFVETITPLAERYACYRGYTMRDHRHTYAVRAARAGTPPQIIADQLGHVNSVLVLKVYGRFFPRSEERDRWEQKASELDPQAGITAEASQVVATERHAAFTPPPPYQQPTKIAWPSIEELLKMLKSAPGVAVAEKLGVSETALRKRLKRHGVTRGPDGRRKIAPGRR